MRPQHPRIRPLEIWDVVIGEKILWDYMTSVEFPIVLNDALEQISKGEAVSRSDGRLPAMEFDGVWLSGGKLLSPRFVEKLSSALFQIPSMISPNVLFPGIAGVRQLLPNGYQDSTCVDVGQTSIKLSSLDRQEVVQRDFERLPIRNDQNFESQDLSSFIEWVIESILNFSSGTNSLVLSLPCEIGESEMLGGSSYISMAGDTELLKRLKEKNVFKDLLLLNDAELAAWAALGDDRLSVSDNTLVLTIGFGVGAALLNAV